jgi:hypothetical protein
VGEDVHTIVATKILTFSSGVDSRIVGMKTESPVLRCWSQLEEACKTIVTVILACKTATLWTCIEQVESQWVPCNCDHHFLILDRMPRSFGGFVFRPKP